MTGLEAARRHGVRRGPDPDGRLHLLVPHEHQPPAPGTSSSSEPTACHRRVLRAGMPLAPVPRAVVDGARRLVRATARRPNCSPTPCNDGLCTVGQLWSRDRGRATAWHGDTAGCAPGCRRRVSDRPQSGARQGGVASSGLPEPWWNAPCTTARQRSSASRTPGGTTSHWPGRSTRSPGTSQPAGLRPRAGQDRPLHGGRGPGTSHAAQAAHRRRRRGTSASCRTRTATPPPAHDRRCGRCATGGPPPRSQQGTPDFAAG